MPFSDHPDYDLFHRLGSPQNFLTRQYGTGGEIERENVNHYSHSQSVFANQAMKCLIDLTRDFDSKNEAVSMEDLYKRIAEERLLIVRNTPDSHFNELALKAAYKIYLGMSRSI
jgi:hypothetical protein